MFVHNAVAYAERRRSTLMIGMQSTPRTVLIRRSASDPSLLPKSALYRKYSKDDPQVTSVYAFKVCLLGNFNLYKF